MNADVQSQLGQLENVRQNMQDLVNPNRMYERLGVDVLSLNIRIMDSSALMQMNILLRLEVIQLQPDMFILED